MPLHGQLPQARTRGGAVVNGLHGKFEQRAGVCRLCCERRQGLPRAQQRASSKARPASAAAPRPGRPAEWASHWRLLRCFGHPWRGRRGSCLEGRRAWRFVPWPSDKNAPQRVHPLARTRSDGRQARPARPRSGTASAWTGAAGAGVASVLPEKRCAARRHQRVTLFPAFTLENLVPDTSLVVKTVTAGAAAEHGCERQEAGQFRAAL